MKQTLLLSLLLSLPAATAMADTPQTCSIAASGHSDTKIRFSWQHGDCEPKSHCNEGDSDMSWGRWTGVTPADLQREGASIDARLKAEAGEMRCVGTVHDSEMHGAYSFTPGMEFTHRMEALGLSYPNQAAEQTPQKLNDRLQGYVMLDITVEWVKAMKDAGVQGMNAENIMGLRALGVDPAYVHGMAAAGYPELDAGKLTGMKAVGVSPEKVQQISAMGYSPTQEELIQMSVFKIDAPFVERMKARGFQNLTIAQLVKIKVFKLDE
jgi:hypothetical protein